MLSITRADLIDELAEVMQDTCDMDVHFSDYAKAIVERLEKLGVRFAREAGSPCPSCARPASVEYSGSSHMGGCPFGADR
jgi:hypothetical protein